MGPLRNANATRLLASAASSGSNVMFRSGIAVSQTLVLLRKLADVDLQDKCAPIWVCTGRSVRLKNSD